MQRIWKKILKLKNDLQYEIEDTGGIMKFLVILLLTLLLWPILMLYFCILKPIYRFIRMLFEAKKLGLKSSFRKWFYPEKYEQEQRDNESEREKEREQKDNSDGPWILDCRKHRYINPDDWPDAYNVDGVAVYGAEGRTLIYVDESVEEFDVPEGVENICHYCFAACNKLRRVKLPQSLKRIGKRAFLDCVALKEIVVPESVYIIDQEMFMNCTSLEHVVLPSQITEIPCRMFCNCRSLRVIQLPESIKTIETEAFRRCYGLEQIKPNERLEIIKEKAFEDCRSLKEFIMPESVKMFTVGMFNGCHSLEHIHFSSQINDFGGSCCEECWNINRISMPPISEEFKRRINDWWAERADKVDISKSECPYPPSVFWTYEDALYFGVPRLTTVCLVFCFSKALEFIIPSFVTNIKRAAFSSCKNLRTLRLSPYITPSCNPWDHDNISYGFICENWPQVENVIFDETLKNTTKVFGLSA